MKKRILIVDDENNVRMMYRTALETEDLDVTEAASGAQAVEEFAKGEFDVAVLDLRMPEMDGLELLQTMRDKNIKTPAVIITAYGDVPNAVKAMKLGAIDFLAKPVTPEELRKLLNEVIQRHAVAMPPARGRRPVPPKYRAEPTLHLLAAKRAINNREFDLARDHLAEVIKQNDCMIEAHNLMGVLFEMKHEYAIAKRCYGRAIAIDSNYEPAQQNMRRIFELFHFGASKESFNLDE
jgi:DNA-binding response OmpR family regulator